MKYSIKKFHIQGIELLLDSFPPQKHSTEDEPDFVVLKANMAAKQGKHSQENSKSLDAEQIQKTMRCLERMIMEFEDQGFHVKCVYPDSQNTPLSGMPELHISQPSSSAAKVFIAASQLLDSLSVEEKISARLENAFSDTLSNYTITKGGLLATRDLRSNLKKLLIQELNTSQPASPRMLQNKLYTELEPYTIEQNGEPALGALLPELVNEITAHVKSFNAATRRR